MLLRGQLEDVLVIVGRLQAVGPAFVEGDVRVVEQLAEELGRAVAAVRDEGALRRDNLRERGGRVRRAANVRRVVARPDDDLIVARPGLWIDRVPVRDEVHHLVGGVHGDEVHVAAPHRVDDHALVARGGQLDLRAGLRLVARRQRRPEAGGHHAPDHRAADDRGRARVARGRPRVGRRLALRAGPMARGERDPEAGDEDDRSASDVPRWPVYSAHAANVVAESGRVQGGRVLEGARGRAPWQRAAHEAGNRRHRAGAPPAPPRLGARTPQRISARSSGYRRSRRQRSRRSSNGSRPRASASAKRSTARTWV